MSRQEIRGTVRSTPRSLASPRVINIHDLRRLARGRLPRLVFDYPHGGAESEVTLRENCRVFDDVTFRPRQAVAILECDLRTRVLSADLAFPAILAPIGYSRLMHPGGEVAAATAAEEAGLAYTLSTISGYKLEDVSGASSVPGPGRLSSKGCLRPTMPNVPSTKGQQRLLSPITVGVNWTALQRP